MNLETSLVNGLTSALEQFELQPLVGLSIGGLDLSLTNSGLQMVAVTLGVILLTQALSFRRKLVGGAWETGTKQLDGMVGEMIAQSSGQEGQKMAGLVSGLFKGIIGVNLVGLVPQRFTASSHLSMTLALAASVWFGKLLIGLRRHGAKLAGILLPAGTPMAIAPLIMTIELVGFLITLVSLSVRLFANMMAGHILLKVLVGFAWTMSQQGVALWLLHWAPLAVLLGIQLMETAVALIQAQVFASLVSLQLSDMQTAGH